MELYIIVEFVITTGCFKEGIAPYCGLCVIPGVYKHSFCSFWWKTLCGEFSSSSSLFPCSLSITCAISSSRKPFAFGSQLRSDYTDIWRAVISTVFVQSHCQPFGGKASHHRELIVLFGTSLSLDLFSANLVYFSSGLCWVVMLLTVDRFEFSGRNVLLLCHDWREFGNGFHTAPQPK